MHFTSFVAAAVFFSATFAAHAESFSFSFGNASNPFSGSGILTTGMLEAPGEYAIATVTGTAATDSNGPSRVIKSLLAPGTFPTIANGGTFPANDNVLFVANGIGSLDSYGLSFILSNGAQINLFNPEGSFTDALLERAGGAEVTENVPITITPVASTPEPSSIALLGTGLLGIAGAMKRRFA